MHKDTSSEGPAESVDDGLDESTSQAIILKGREYAKCKELDTRARRIKDLGGGEVRKPKRGLMQGSRYEGDWNVRLGTADSYETGPGREDQELSEEGGRILHRENK